MSTYVSTHVETYARAWSAAYRAALTVTNDARRARAMADAFMSGNDTRLAMLAKQAERADARQGA